MVGVHVESVDREVVSGQVERFKHLPEREVLVVAEDDHFLLTRTRKWGQLIPERSDSVATHLRAALHLALDETEHVLLVHACRVVDVRINLEVLPSALGRK